MYNWKGVSNLQLTLIVQTFCFQKFVSQGRFKTELYRLLFGSEKVIESVHVVYHVVVAVLYSFFS